MLNGDSIEFDLGIEGSRLYLKQRRCASLMSVGEFQCRLNKRNLKLTNLLPQVYATVHSQFLHAAEILQLTQKVPNLTLAVVNTQAQQALH